MLEAPERITTFALEATLYQYTADGYSVFVVRSAAPSNSYSTAVTLPAPDSDGPDSGGDPKGLYTQYIVYTHLLLTIVVLMPRYVVLKTYKYKAIT
jgi:hypothetical protein